MNMRFDKEEVGLILDALGEWKEEHLENMRVAKVKKEENCVKHHETEAFKTKSLILKISTVVCESGGWNQGS